MCSVAQEHVSLEYYNLVGPVAQVDYSLLLLLLLLYNRRVNVHYSLHYCYD